MSENTTTTTATETEEFLPMVDVDHEFTLPEAPEAEETMTIEVIDIVAGIVGDAKDITAYGIHTVINEAFKVLGVDIKIRPQMMYNYARNGLIVKGQKGTTTYTAEQVIEFATKYVTKKTN